VAAISSSGSAGPAVTQSMNATGDPPRATMFHGPVSRWLMIASAASLANGQGCQAARRGGVKPAVASCRLRSRRPTWKTPSSLHACGWTDSPGDVRHDVLAVGADRAGAAGEPRPLQVIQQGVHCRRPRAGRAADDVTVDHDGTKLILHPCQGARRRLRVITDFLVHVPPATVDRTPLPAVSSVRHWIADSVSTSSRAEVLCAARRSSGYSRVRAPVINAQVLFG
jgi:hypothetical protein